MKIFYKICAIIASQLIVFSAAAETGKPYPWQLGFQAPASPMMERSDQFHDILLFVIWSIGLFVFALMVYVCWRFSAKRNPVPSKTSHNTKLEVLWTAIPVIILTLICIPSLKHLYYVDKTNEAEMTLKIIGYQWYWGYQYPDHENISFESYMIPDEELPEDGLRLLEVDNRVVLPVDTNIRLQMTSADVIHAWAMPALGIKMDAVPGRLNETWVRINKKGVYYGQCSELCGVGHGFMPIAIQAVSKERFKRWAARMSKKTASGKTTGEVLESVQISSANISKGL